MESEKKKTAMNHLCLNISPKQHHDYGNKQIQGFLNIVQEKQFYLCLTFIVITYYTKLVTYVNGNVNHN